MTTISERKARKMYNFLRKVLGDRYMPYKVKLGHMGYRLEVASSK
jgi:hypothetical protein